MILRGCGRDKASNGRAARSEPSQIRWRLADFYEAAIDAAMPDTTRLAQTIRTWWLAVLVPSAAFTWIG